MIGAIVRDTTQQKQIQHMLLESHTILERAVKERIVELTQANGMLEKPQAALRSLAAHQNRIREEERSRIAREVHGELGGHLAGIQVCISTAVEELNNHGSGSTKLLNQASIMVDESVKMVRKVITELRPSVLDQLGIWPALEWYADQFGQQTSIQCNCALDAVDGIQIAPEGSTMIFRIVQESRTNIARHAQASEVTIRGTCIDDRLLIEIEDNGVGFEVDKLYEQKSWGIIGMRARAFHFGADLLISAQPNFGTTISLQIPLSHENKYCH
jgi:signal transduction histidine kinase